MAIKNIAGSAGARRYARALLLIAQEKNQISEFKQQLERVALFFEEHPDLFIQLLSPALSKRAREKILKQIIPAFALSPEMENFLLLLNLKARLELLPQIYSAYLALSDQALGIQRALVFSAKPLRDNEKQKLIETLKKRTGKTILAEFQVDPELIGGVKVQIGSQLWDGSVRAQLKLMEEKLRRI